MAKSVTRVPLGGCPKYCPFPASPEWHEPWCLHARREIHHHHIVPRSQGGDDGQMNICALCPDCHTAVHARLLRTGVKDGMFLLWHARGKLLGQVRMTGDWVRDPYMRRIGGAQVAPGPAGKGDRLSPRGQITNPTHDEPFDSALAVQATATLPPVERQDYEKATTALSLPGVLTPTAWELPADLTYDRYASLGTVLGRMGRSWQWWAGDWLCHGEAAYGELYAQAASDSGIDEQTLMNVASVSRRVPVSLRRERLTWSHHEVVAKLTREEQAQWLEEAETNGWTVRELRKAIKGEAECEHVSTVTVLKCADCGAVVE